MPPSTTEDFKRIEKVMWEKWNMPNCVSSIDGKHVRIKAPQHSGSLFFNSMIGKKIARNDFNIPESKVLPGTNINLPHFLIGDEAFPLDKNMMMKPYSRRSKLDHQKEVFNYRLCRARRVAENAFGLLSQVFRVFYTPIAIAPDTCTDLILVACCFHNLLRDGYLEINNRPYYIRDENQNPTDNMIDLAATTSTVHDGINVRNQLKLFFNSQIGQVSWQNNYC